MVSHQYNIIKNKKQKRTIHDNQGKKDFNNNKKKKTEIKKYTYTKVLDIVGNAAQKIALKR